MISNFNFQSSASPDDISQEAEPKNTFPEEVSGERAFTDDEKFELLSAYLDDEVSLQERHLVEHWLSVDPSTQQHYQAQLKLRQAIRWHCDAPKTCDALKTSLPSKPHFPTASTLSPINQNMHKKA
ncbi:MAG: hypothetical protein HC800_11495 [Phormidesmis sp. RL_2_1]|nr:hypothetical protein [Phormidesmis sp. RL_2_1]